MNENDEKILKEIKDFQKRNKNKIKKLIKINKKKFDAKCKRDTNEFYCLKERQIYETHQKDWAKEYYKAYYQKNRAKMKILRFKNKIKVIKMLGGKYVNCGITDIRILVVNHKHGCGKKQRKKEGYIYGKILRGELPLSDFDIRCYNCNVLYEYERGNLSLPSDIKPSF